MNAKKYGIILTNVVIVLGIIIFVIAYATRQRHEILAARVETFENLTLAMEQVTANYLAQEQQICDTWARCVEQGGMTMEEARDCVRRIQPDFGTASAHLIYVDDGSMSGLSTRARTDDASAYAVSYASLNLFKPAAELGELGREVNITRAYTNPMDGKQSIAFYDRVSLRENGVRRDALLLRVVPTSELAGKWVFPTEEYRDAEISLIDRSGSYIIKSSSFKNASFFEFYKSYNLADYAAQPDMEKEFAAETGSFTMRNSKGETCLIAHTPVNSMEGWAIVSYLPAESLSRSGVNWTLLIAVVAALLLLLAFDLAVMQTFNRTLQRTAEAAKNASRAKSDFLSNMSHEIRTPITAILGMNEMIQRESRNPDVLEYSDSIRKAGVSLLGIISDILDFSKIEAGRMELTEADYDLTGMIDSVVNLTLLRAEGKGLSMRVEVDPALPERLRGDDMRVKQILTNLLSNAVKYTEKGSVTFSCALGGWDGDAALIHFAVTDTGIGIREEEMDKLFTAFDRLDTEHTRTVEGTGLGLAITAKMLSLMGSELKVESTYGKGSTFFFTLRQTVIDRTAVGDFDPMRSQRENKTRDSARTPFVAPDARILIVDDTQMNLQVFKGLLKRTKMHVEVAGSGAECIERFANEDFDLIFLDYRMPEMDGIETLGRLTELYPEKRARTPVISLTASAVSGDREKMLAAGFDDYITKPVNIDEMENMLIRCLPKEKVVLTPETGVTEEDPASVLPEELFDVPLLDPADGLRFCGDAESYLEALGVFARSIEPRAAEIEQKLASRDLEGYTISVHSLKSTSRTIGAPELSERAKALEQAGNRRDEALLLRDTPTLLEAYRSLRQPLERILNIGGADTAEKAKLSEAEFDEAMRSIGEFCAEYDDSGVDAVMETLADYEIPASRRERYERMTSAAGRVDWEAMSRIAAEGGANNEENG